MPQVWLSAVKPQSRYEHRPLFTYTYTDGRGGPRLGSFVEWSGGVAGMAMYTQPGSALGEAKYHRSESRRDAEWWLRRMHEEQDPVNNQDRDPGVSAEVMDDIDAHGREGFRACCLEAIEPTNAEDPK
ncbi:hypothetical protein [Streptomyces sp. NPDC014733]|uniref:hypothetical protein n=1 Tax=Streptomyces sp. NPDC014733 TaxID=3364885 RepID=UPI0036FA0D5F